jgi:hypothetical protein
LYALLVWWRRVELKKAQKWLSHLQWMKCLEMTSGMRSRPTSTLEVMFMLSSIHLLMKQEARHAAVNLKTFGGKFVEEFINFTCA